MIIDVRIALVNDVFLGSCIHNSQAFCVVGLHLYRCVYWRTFLIHWERLYLPRCIYLLILAGIAEGCASVISSNHRMKTGWHVGVP
jgi:hypothetical protein